MICERDERPCSKNCAHWGLCAQRLNALWRGFRLCCWAAIGLLLAAVMTVMFGGCVTAPPRIVCSDAMEAVCDYAMVRAAERVGHRHKGTLRVVTHLATVKCKSGRYGWYLTDGRLCSGVYYPTKKCCEVAVHRSAPQSYPTVIEHEMTHYLGHVWEGDVTHNPAWADADPAWVRKYDLGREPDAIDVYPEEAE